MKKNGFVFIETIVVVAVLATSLIMLYSGFNGILSNEKRRAKYEDAAFLYRTFYLSRYLNEVSTSPIDLALTDTHLIDGIGINFITKDSEVSFWEELLNSSELDIIGLYVAKNNLKPLDSCEDTKDTSLDCEVLNYNAGTGWQNYVKSLSSGEGIRLIGAYAKGGVSCLSSNVACDFYYASLKVGE